MTGSARVPTRSPFDRADSKSSCARDDAEPSAGADVLRVALELAERPDLLYRRAPDGVLRLINMTFADASTSTTPARSRLPTCGDRSATSTPTCAERTRRALSTGERNDKGPRSLTR